MKAVVDKNRLFLQKLLKSVHLSMHTSPNKNLQKLKNLKHAMKPGI